MSKEPRTRSAQDCRAWSRLLRPAGGSARLWAAAPVSAGPRRCGQPRGDILTSASLSHAAAAAAAAPIQFVDVGGGAAVTFPSNRPPTAASAPPPTQAATSPSSSRRPPREESRRRPSLAMDRRGGTRSGRGGEDLTRGLRHADPASRADALAERCHGSRERRELLRQAYDGTDGGAVCSFPVEVPHLLAFFFLFPHAPHLYGAPRMWR